MSLSKIFNTKSFYLLLTLIAGIVILLPQMNYQTNLAQGDHGRDLYTYKKTFEGCLVYRDFDSRNGPLMPYYYSLFYRLFGVSIQSTVWGYVFLIYLIGVFTYLICSTSLSPPMSFICALFYWAFREKTFFYTYNHIGAVFLTQTVLFCLFQYIKTLKIRYLNIGSLASFFILLIRPNIGVACLAAFYISAALTDRFKKGMDVKKILIRYFLYSALVLSAAYLIYWGLTHALPKTASSGDLTYWKYAKANLFGIALFQLLNTITATFTANWIKGCAGLLLLIAIIKFSSLLQKESPLKHEQKTELALLTFSLAIFSVFYLGEFMVSALWIRVVWSLPILTILLFFILDHSTASLNRFFKNIIKLTLALTALFFLTELNSLISYNKNQKNLLTIGQNKIYLSSQQQEWIKTVSQASAYIKNNVPLGEKIVAVRYNPLYYFLTNHDSGIKDLAFTKNVNREIMNIEQMEKSHVNYVIISNRAINPVEKHYGIVGKTTCLQLATYLDKNFETVATFGPWDLPAGWVGNHAVKVLRRK